jgi:hypothetical protein
MTRTLSTKTLAVVTAVLLVVFIGSVIAGLVLTRQPALERVPVPTLTQS